MRLTSSVKIETLSNRGVHGPVRSGFNIKNQPNRKILFLVNITRTNWFCSVRVGFLALETRKTETN